MDRKRLFLRRSLDLHRNLNRMVPSQRHSLGRRHMLVLRMDRMLFQRRSLVHKLTCEKACPLIRKA